ncbi:amino acid permease family protein [Geobacillus proteiniphilus]|uniref:Amino acid permease family protein n=1 Tax=Geobacillus proteiniphilus TaxID=860353 RepID=A0A1Q5T974_9BACL|nr:MULTISPECIES: amino acid permease [Geobacillus]AKM20665.1 Proline-specific permease ProY [Geobacillus sp. 12AMOR1]STO35941.1 Proline-specific permease ProY [[Flavobacterium] thermophilum]MDF9297223.1 amino acid permease [Geobacillus stearothermophilus]OKO96786.1 amino acid permease family protein [Geobacillus proteiniphilus]OPX04160.1 hypothetical protein B1A75_04430 [Geobacillus sp. LEMMY01]
MEQKQPQLHRGLEERHISLMSLGAAIGVGLFLGSASAIEMAGPAILLGYAVIINFVVLTAALSSCNSGIFSTSRMLFNLAEQQEAPSAFGRLTKRGIPGAALIATALVMLVGVYLNYVSEKVFQWVTSIATFGAIWTWAVILLSQLKFRKQLSAEQAQRLTFKLPLHPYSSYVSLAFLIGVAALMAYFPDTRIALIIGPAWLLLLTAVYFAKGMHRRQHGQAEEKQAG